VTGGIETMPRGDPRRIYIGDDQPFLTDLRLRDPAAVWRDDARAAVVETFRLILDELVEREVSGNVLGGYQAAHQHDENAAFARDEPRDVSRLRGRTGRAATCSLSPSA
jgi:hypothetical protein